MKDIKNHLKSIIKKQLREAKNEQFENENSSQLNQTKQEEYEMAVFNRHVPEAKSKRLLKKPVRRYH